MHRLFAITLAIALALSLSVPALARGATLDPTIVTVNADGTVTFTTTAAPRQGLVRLCIQGTIIGPNGETEITECFIVDASSITAEGTTYTLSAEEAAWWAPHCPCVAYFVQASHYGNWHPYSAPSETFTL